MPVRGGGGGEGRLAEGEGGGSGGGGRARQQRLGDVSQLSVETPSGDTMLLVPHGTYEYCRWWGQVLNLHQNQHPVNISDLNPD